MGLFSFLTKEIAIDLGTANTIIIYNDKVVVDEPSIVALERNTGKVIAVGKKAMMMHGKTHENIRTIRPLRDGVIADFKAAEIMIREMIKMIGFKNNIFPPALKMVICIPSGITEVEERAVKDSAEQAGAKYGALGVLDDEGRLLLRRDDRRPGLDGVGRAHDVLLAVGVRRGRQPGGEQGEGEAGGDLLHPCHRGWLLSELERCLSKVGATRSFPAPRPIPRGSRIIAGRR